MGFATAAYADQFHIRVVGDSDAALVNAGESEVVNVFIQGMLDSDGMGGASTSEGLALWGSNLSDAGTLSVDLCNTSGFLVGATAGAANFDRNLGLTNPPGPNPSDMGVKTGYKGTCNGAGVLLQIGGGQNTIGNTDPPQYPVGSVTTGIAKDVWFDLAEGTITTPGAGAFTDDIVLTLDSPFANVLDDTGTGMPPVFAVSAAEGTHIDGALTIHPQTDTTPPEMTAGVSRRIHGGMPYNVDVFVGQTEPRTMA
jgi:hypothetical protein